MPFRLCRAFAIRNILHFLLLILLATPCLAQEKKLPDWQQLLNTGKTKKAKTLCQSWAESKDTALQFEGEHCLANVALCGNEITSIQANDTGGGTISNSYKPEALDEAMKHLDAAVKLAPQNLRIHEERLDLLRLSGRYQAMAKALDESCDLYHGNDGLETWLSFVAQLSNDGELNAAFSLSRVLDKRYPRSHDVVGNIGALLSMQKKDTEALPYLKQAVELAPDDPIDTWNLGKSYEVTGQTELADTWLQKGISLDTDQDRKHEKLCRYSRFVATKLNDQTRACTLQKANCPDDQQSACSDVK